MRSQYTTIVFIANPPREWDGSVGAMLIEPSELAAVQQESNVVDTITLDPEKHRGELLIVAMADETIGTPEESKSFYGAFKRCLQEAFLAGVKHGQAVDRAKLEE